MESRIRVLFLKAVLIGGALQLGVGCSALAPVFEEGGRGPVVDPQVERRDIRQSRIDTENFELTAFGGSMSVDDFGTSAVYGARLAYHFSESFFAEAVVGQTEAGETSFEALSGAAPLLTDDERTFRYYDLSIGWNVLPGEVFLGRDRAFTSALYLVAGAGNTEFGGENLFTANVGAGYRLLLTDYVATHLLVRDRAFTSDLLGEDKVSHNIEFSLGLSWFF